MQIYLSQVIFFNRSPIPKLELTFNKSEVAVFTGVNGRGKTTILSHIVDAFYEMTKHHFTDISENVNSYYRVSSGLDHLDASQPSLVYMRFKADEHEIDYVDLRGPCTLEQYAAAIDKIENAIPFAGDLERHITTAGNGKVVSSNLTKELAIKIFSSNITAYFPSYRYEIPSYLNTPYQERLSFKKNSKFTGRLDRPLEIAATLGDVANWLMDVVLDMSTAPEASHKLFNSLNTIITNTISSKGLGTLRFGIGGRHLGGSRIQILQMQQGVLDKTVYPTIFRLSSGESALLCIFAELLRHADVMNTGGNLLDATGIVLIDEIDKHLHIKLQKEVLPALLHMFPNIQFIVSAHSPFLGMGLAEHLADRSHMIDVQTGLAITPSTDPQYVEVYEMMISENSRFKQMYESVLSQIEFDKQIQLISEGDNISHIKHALSVRAADLLTKIKFIVGAENRSGDMQLKNAFETMSKAKHVGKFLFVWDCDSAPKVDPIVETDSFHKFCFAKNAGNNVAKKGIENVYSENLFTEDLYETKVIEMDYGGAKTERSFNKNRFCEKIEQLADPEAFAGYQPLIDKLRILLEPISIVES